MRLAILAVVAVFQSCQPEVKPDPQPEAQPQTTQVLGDKLDKADSRVASAVQVAREANTAGKPAKVEAELAVAAAYLPTPSQVTLPLPDKGLKQLTPKPMLMLLPMGTN